MKIKLRFHNCLFSVASKYFGRNFELDITNYRTISILPVVSKVYEGVFHRKFYNLATIMQVAQKYSLKSIGDSVNNILSSYQLGFRSVAAVHALLKFLIIF